METERLTEQLIALAKEHGLTIIEDMGVSGPRFTIMDRKDADYYMAVVYGHVPPVLH